MLTVSDGRDGTDTASVAVTVNPAPPAFPLTAVLDDFNRANGAVGGFWTPGTGLSISGNQLKPTVRDVSSVWNGGAFGSNQEAYITLNGITANSTKHALMLKVQGLSWNTGHIEVRYDQKKKRVVVSTYDAGAGWVARGSPIGVTMAAGNQLGARAESDGILTVYRNGAAIGAVSIVGWPFYAAGGRLGLSFTIATNSLLDNFGGGDLVGPGPRTTIEPARAEAAIPDLTLLALSNSFPNPTGGAISFTLDLPRGGQVELAVLDLQGREVWRDSAREFGPGRWTIGWDGASATGALARSGLYFVRVIADGRSFVRRIALVR